MRLLQTETLKVVEVRDDAVPEYAILSHTWMQDEVSLQDLDLLQRKKTNVDSLDRATEIEETSGFAKIVRASAMAVEYGYDYVWIDTCCIDKTSSAELSEAINSMFRWYEAAGICFAYLTDVQPLEIEDPAADGSSFRRSRWFTRGVRRPRCRPHPAAAALTVDSSGPCRN